MQASPSTPPPAATQAVSDRGDVVAQLGAWRTRAKAEETVRAARAVDSPAPPPIRVAAAQVRGVRWWRVVAGPMRVEEARALCLRLAASAPCWTRRLEAGGAGRESP